jgi:hypothetical protein
MRKTILTILGAVLVAASTVQIAAAAEHHRVPKVQRAPAPASEQFRDTNDYYAPFRDSNDYYAPSSPWQQPDWSRYQNGAESAPAGR